MGKTRRQIAREKAIISIYQNLLVESSLDEIKVFLKEKLNCNVLYNSTGNNIKSVAFCSGSGGDLFALAKECGADALLTGEAKYHEFLDASFNNITIFSCGHFETEVVVIDSLKEKLQNEFKNVEFIKANQKNVITCK